MALPRPTVDDTVPYVIPTLANGVPYYTFRTKLDGRDYNFRFAWNQRMERWFMDIMDTEENPLALGIKIVANQRLLRFYQHDDRLPPGELMAVDLSGDGSPPGFYDLGIGKRCELSYFAVTETEE